MRIGLPDPQGLENRQIFRALEKKNVRRFRRIRRTLECLISGQTRSLKASGYTVNGSD